jgi:dephospho-CoA kinase
MIVGITGTICAGKLMFVQFLMQTYGFEAVNLQKVFKHILKGKIADLKKKANSSADSNKDNETLKNSGQSLGF